MSYRGLFLIFIVMLAITVALTDAKSDKKSLHITSLEIRFDRNDAIFTFYYDYDRLSETYFLIFGAKTIEPKIRYIFPNFEYETIKIDQNKAIIRVKNISRLNKGYYLHDSQKFSETIEVVYILDSSNTKVREYHNINSTPNYFYSS